MVKFLGKGIIMLCRVPAHSNIPLKGKKKFTNIVLVVKGSCNEVNLAFMLYVGALLPGY